MKESETTCDYKRLVVGGSVKNPGKSKESSPLPLFRTFKISAKIGTLPRSRPVMERGLRYDIASDQNVLIKAINCTDYKYISSSAFHLSSDTKVS